VWRIADATRSRSAAKKFFGKAARNTRDISRTSNWRRLNVFERGLECRGEFCSFLVRSCFGRASETGGNAMETISI
jgi:hypothetical protein